MSDNQRVAEIEARLEEATRLNEWEYLQANAPEYIKFLLSALKEAQGENERLRKAFGKHDIEAESYPCQVCGEHSSFWRTVTRSEQWQAWEDEADKQGFDFHECTECGWISADHFAAFLRFVNTLPPAPKGDNA